MFYHTNKKQFKNKLQTKKSKIRTFETIIDFAMINAAAV